MVLCGVAWYVWGGLTQATAVRLWRRELWVRRTDAVHDVKEAPETVTVDEPMYMAPPWHRHSRREEGADHAVGQDVCRGCPSNVQRVPITDPSRATCQQVVP